MLPNQASAGVGAVIFDKPKYDAQEIGLKVQADLEDWGKQKALADQAKLKVAKDLTKDLDYEAKDFLPEGAAQIKAKADILKQKQTDYEMAVYNAGADSETANLKKKEAEIAKSDLQILANNLQQAAKILTDNKPDATTDLDAYNKLVVDLRTSAGENALGDKFYKSLQQFGKPVKPKGIIEVSDEFMKNIPLQKTERVVGKDGNIIEEGTSFKLKPIKYDAKGAIVDDGDFDLVTGAPASLALTPEYQNAIKPLFVRLYGASQRLDAGEQLSASEMTDASLYKYYVDEAAKESQRYGKPISPETIYARGELERRNQVENTSTFKEQTAATKEMAKVGAEQSVKKNAAKGLINWFIEVDRGSPEIYTNMTISDVAPKYDRQVYATKVLSPISVGQKFETKEGANGALYKVTTPDYVRYFMQDKETGTKFYATDSSIDDFNNGKISSPFKQYKNIAEVAAQATFVNGADQSIDNMKNYWAEVGKEKGYSKEDGNGIIYKEGREIAPFTKTEQQKYGANPQQTMIKAGTTLPKYEKGKVPADFTGQYLEVEYKDGDGKVLEIIKSTPRVATATKQPTTATPQQTAPKATEQKSTAPKQDAPKKEETEITEEDKQALKWLNANPNAEQAVAIRNKLKAKGLIK
jgi:hypothetical protein